MKSHNTIPIKFSYKKKDASSSPDFNGDALVHRGNALATKLRANLLLKRGIRAIGRNE